MKNPDKKYGFTLVEVMLAVVIIAMLAALIIPASSLAIRSRENAQAASKLRTLVAAFELYASENGDYPADVSRGIVPSGMSDYFASLKITWFTDATPLGGNWDWGKNQLSAVATIAIAAPTVASSQMQALDKLLDNGISDLNAGKFRYNGSEHYYYIIKP
jgi:prepilin-type N-terminal cleavage/methylation domain-containing protein